MGIGVPKELIHMTHGPEQIWGNCLRGVGESLRAKEGKIETTVAAQSIKYF